MNREKSINAKLKKSVDVRLKIAFIVGLIPVVMAICIAPWRLKQLQNDQLYFQEDQKVYAQYDGVLISGSQVVRLLKESAHLKDTPVTFIIDNGVKVQEYSGYSSKVIDKADTDCYIKPRDAYKGRTERGDDGKIKTLTFNLSE